MVRGEQHYGFVIELFNPALTAGRIALIRFPTIQRIGDSSFRKNFRRGQQQICQACGPQQQDNVWHQSSRPRHRHSISRYRGYADPWITECLVSTAFCHLTTAMPVFTA